MTGSSAPAGGVVDCPRPLRRARRRIARWLLASATLAVATLSVVTFGCSTGEVTQPDPTPTAVMTGPTFLYGSVGSLAKLHGYDPMLVSGYGIVVGLNGTGSADVPAFLREWLRNEARKKGVGSRISGISDDPEIDGEQDGPRLTPEGLLASPNKAVVTVEGLIPPGAAKGTRFDLLVTALPQTQTTSLEGGMLWTAELALDGANPQLRFVRPLASGRGEVYANPFDDEQPAAQRLELKRQAVVLNGGVATAARDLELVLTTPSWNRSRLISDRINERYPRDMRNPDDRDDTAVAKNDTTIKLFIPARFRGREEELLTLISHIYLQRVANFETEQAERLGAVLLADIRKKDDVRLAWVSLGKLSLPVLRRFYADVQPQVRLVALEAGVELGDDQAAGPLVTMTQSGDASLRRDAARVLSHLPSSDAGTRALGNLLNDPDKSVRLQAYDSLASMGDPRITSRLMGDRANPKFMLDVVPSNYPGIYISQIGMPHIAVFSPNTGFKTPMLAKVWENRLMIEAEDGESARVYFQPAPGRPPVIRTTKPTVANLLYLLADSPSNNNLESVGMDMTYSQVVAALYALRRADLLKAEMDVQMNPLATAVAAVRQTPGMRPEHDATADLEPTTRPSEPSRVGMRPEH